MVATRFFVYVFALCLVQALHAETVEEVLVEMYPKVFQLYMKAYEALHKTEPAIGRVMALTEIKKTLGMVTVQFRVDSLRESIKKAETEAHAAGKDIEKCVNHANESLSSLKVKQEIAKCNATQEIQKATENLQALKKLFNDINTIDEECLKGVSEEDPAGDLRKCMEDFLELGSKSVVEFKDNIDTSANFAIKKIYSCVDTLVESGLDNVSKISKEFNKCVSEA